MGAAWTSGSSGTSTSHLYSWIRYRVRSCAPSVEEVVEDAVDILWTLGLGRVAGARDDGQGCPVDQALRPLRVGQRKQRVARAPDELDRDLELVQAPGHIVLASEQSARIDERAHRREVGAAVAVGGVHVAKVGQVLVVEGLVEVDGGAGVSSGEAPDHPPLRPAQLVARGSHHV